MTARIRSPLYTALRKHGEALASIKVHERWIVKLHDRVRDLEREIEALGGFPKRRASVVPMAVRGEMQKTLYDLLRERACQAFIVSFSMHLRPETGGAHWALRAAGHFARLSRGDGDGCMLLAEGR